MIFGKKFESKENSNVNIWKKGDYQVQIRLGKVGEGHCDGFNYLKKLFV